MLFSNKNKYGYLKEGDLITSPLHSGVNKVSHITENYVCTTNITTGWSEFIPAHGVIEYATKEEIAKAIAKKIAG